MEKNKTDAQTVDVFASAEEYLSGKVRWTIHESSDDFQLRYALDMITAYVNKRDRGQFLPSCWCVLLTVFRA